MIRLTLVAVILLTGCSTIEPIEPQEEQPLRIVKKSDEVKRKVTYFSQDSRCFATGSDSITCRTKRIQARLEQLESNIHEILRGVGDCASCRD